MWGKQQSPSILMMKAQIEKVAQRKGFSWRYRKLEEAEKTQQWHYHDEYELVLHRHFTGDALISHYQGNISHNNLILIAPHIPHTFTSHHCVSDNALCETHMLWFKPVWMASMMNNCTELRQLNSILKRSQKGLQFSENIAEKVYQIINGLADTPPIEQLSKLIQVFSCLCEEKQSDTLLSYSLSGNDDLNPDNKEKIEKLCRYIDEHYHKPITLTALSNYMNASESSIHRLFTLHFGENFSNYLKKLRLGHASDLLISSSLPVSLVAERVGYLNLSNFNRQFKDYRGITPRNYRQKFKQSPKV